MHSSTRAHRQHANRAAGAVDELDALMHQLVQPIAEDRMSVPPADLHDVDGLSRGSPRFRPRHARLRPERPWRPSDRETPRTYLIDRTSSNALLAFGHLPPASPAPRQGLSERLERFPRLIFVDHRHREAHMDQHPGADETIKRAGGHGRQRHFAPHARDIGHGHLPFGIGDLR